MNKHILILIASAAISLNTSFAQTVVSMGFGNSVGPNQNVNNSAYAGPTNIGSAGVTAGVVNSGYWTDISIRGGGTNYASGGNLTNLTADDGNASTLDASFTFPTVGGPNLTQVPATSADNRLYRAHISANTTDATMTLSDMTSFLTANTATSYNVYIYGLITGNVANTGRFSITDGTTTYYQSATLSSSTPWFDGTFTEVTNTNSATAAIGDYVRFSGLTGNTSTFTVSNFNNTGNPNFRWAGVQVVAVPEPSTFAFLVAALVPLLFIIRRRVMLSKNTSSKS